MTKKKKNRPRDISQRAKAIIDIAVGEKEDTRDKAAMAFSRADRSGRTQPWLRHILAP